MGKVGQFPDLTVVTTATVNTGVQEWNPICLARGIPLSGGHGKAAMHLYGGNSSFSKEIFALWSI